MIIHVYVCGKKIKEFEKKINKIGLIETARSFLRFTEGDLQEIKYCNCLLAFGKPEEISEEKKCAKEEGIQIFTVKNDSELAENIDRIFEAMLIL